MAESCGSGQSFCGENCGRVLLRPERELSQLAARPPDRSGWENLAHRLTGEAAAVPDCRIVY